MIMDTEERKPHYKRPIYSPKQRAERCRRKIAGYRKQIDRYRDMIDEQTKLLSELTWQIHMTELERRVHQAAKKTAQSEVSRA